MSPLKQARIELRQTLALATPIIAGHIGQNLMVPLGLALATAVRMGRAVGAGDTGRLRPIAFGSLGASIGFMGPMAIVFIFAGPLIASGFVKDPVVVSTAAGLLIVAGMFQIFDGAQVVAMGALRGLSDVRIPTVITFLGYWVIGVPCAWLLAFPAGIGGIGVWLGLLIGLAICAIWLSMRLWRRTAPEHG